MFARLVLTAATLAGSLMLVLLELLILTARDAYSKALSLRCLLAPVTLIDIMMHGLALAISVLVGWLVFRALVTMQRAAAGTRQLQCRLPVAQPEHPAWRLEETARACGLAGRVDLVETTRPLAFAYGWWRPRVCVSTQLVADLTATELRAVLLHEGWHVTQRDPLRFVLARTIGAVFTALPFVRRLVYEFIVSAEIAADRHAVAEMGDTRSLASALLKLAGQPSPAPAFTDVVDHRVAALVGEPQPRPASTIIPSVILLAEAGLLVLLLTNGSFVTLSGIWVHGRC